MLYIANSLKNVPTTSIISDVQISFYRKFIFQQNVAEVFSRYNIEINGRNRNGIPSFALGEKKATCITHIVSANAQKIAFWIW